MVDKKRKSKSSHAFFNRCQVEKNNLFTETLQSCSVTDKLKS